MAKNNKKEIKSYVLFDNYNVYNFEEIKKEIAECNERDIESITDDEVWDLLNEEESEDYDNAKWELKAMFGADDRVIVCGSCGTWQGNRDAMRICDNIEDALYRYTKDCDYIKIEVEGRKVRVKSSHHDGTNYFEIKKITDKGKSLFDNWDYQYRSRLQGLSEHEILEKIWNDSHYSVYGKKIA